ncbi:MAG: hypothetical protein ACI81S_000840 [Sphingobacteriales bacterium]|jgi:hypothetical protein
MKFPLFLMLMVTGFSCLAQKNISGRIIAEEKGKTPVSYANIGIPGKNLGTVSNLNGEYSLSIPDSLSKDSVRFSAIGFKPKTLAIKDLQKLKEISLSAQIFDIPEVEIKSSKLKEKILGYKTDSRAMQAGFTSNKLGNEVGVRIKTKGRETYLKEFATNISSNTYDTVKFRLNIYTIKDDLPHQNILKENIIITTTIEQGRVAVDLTPYKIWIDEDVIVTMEWIEDLGEQGLYFSAGFLGTVYGRQTSQGDWEKVSGIRLGLNMKVAY